MHRDSKSSPPRSSGCTAPLHAPAAAFVPVCTLMHAARSPTGAHATEWKHAIASRVRRAPDSISASWKDASREVRRDCYAHFIVAHRISLTTECSIYLRVSKERSCQCCRFQQRQAYLPKYFTIGLDACCA